MISTRKFACFLRMSFKKKDTAVFLWHFFYFVQKKTKPAFASHFRSDFKVVRQDRIFLVQLQRQTICVDLIRLRGDESGFATRN